jgi:hypothetical protein
MGNDLPYSRWTLKHPAKKQPVSPLKGQFVGENVKILDKAMG